MRLLTYKLHLLTRQGEINEFEIDSSTPLSREECENKALAYFPDGWKKCYLGRFTSFFSENEIEVHETTMPTRAWVWYNQTPISRPIEWRRDENHAIRFMQHLAWRLIETSHLDQAEARITSLLKAYGLLDPARGLVSSAIKAVEWMGWTNPKLLKMISFLEELDSIETNLVGGIQSLNKGRKY